MMQTQRTAASCDKNNDRERTHIQELPDDRRTDLSPVMRLFEQERLSVIYKLRLA